MGDLTILAHWVEVQWPITKGWIKGHIFWGNEPVIELTAMAYGGKVMRVVRCRSNAVGSSSNILPGGRTNESVEGELISTKQSLLEWNYGHSNREMGFSFEKCRLVRSKNGRKNEKSNVGSFGEIKERTFLFWVLPLKSVGLIFLVVVDSINLIFGLVEKNGIRI